MALSDTSRQIAWIQSLFNELGYQLWQIPVCADNQRSIFIRSNPVQERRTKHIDICYHYIYECIEEGKVSVFFIPGSENPVDMFTKNLGKDKFLEFCEHLSISFTNKQIHHIICLQKLIAFSSPNAQLHSHQEIGSTLI